MVEGQQLFTYKYAHLYVHTAGYACACQFWGNIAIPYVSLYSYLVRKMSGFKVSNSPQVTFITPFCLIIIEW